MRVLVTPDYRTLSEEAAALVARVGAPVPSPRVFVDGKPVAPAADGTVSLRGSHVIEVLRR